MDPESLSKLMEMINLGLSVWGAATGTAGFLLASFLAWMRARDHVPRLKLSVHLRSGRHRGWYWVLIENIGVRPINVLEWRVRIEHQGHKSLIGDHTVEGMPPDAMQPGRLEWLWADKGIEPGTRIFAWVRASDGREFGSLKKPLMVVPSDDQRNAWYRKRRA